MCGVFSPIFQYIGKIENSQNYTVGSSLPVQATSGPPVSRLSSPFASFSCVHSKPNPLHPISTLSSLTLELKGTTPLPLPKDLDLTSGQVMPPSSPLQPRSLCSWLLVSPDVHHPSRCTHHKPEPENCSHPADPLPMKFPLSLPWLCSHLSVGKTQLANHPTTVIFPKYISDHVSLWLKTFPRCPSVDTAKSPDRAFLSSVIPDVPQTSANFKGAMTLKNKNSISICF